LLIFGYNFREPGSGAHFFGWELRYRAFVTDALAFFCYLEHLFTGKGKALKS